MPLRSANIIGSGVNGLAAAITLAQQGVAVTVFERNERIGGACSTAEITLPGFRHDLGSSCYPMGVSSPFLNSLPLAKYGFRWIEPDAAVAHPLDDGTAVMLEHSLEATADQFAAETGGYDAHAWRALMASSVRDWPGLVYDFMHPLLRIPSNPVAMATFGTAALWPAKLLSETIFRGERARALLAGCAGHAVLPLTRIVSAATGLVLATAGHTTGWPVIAGGAQSLPDAMAAYLHDLGGKIVTGQNIRYLHELADDDVTIFDTSVRGMERIAGDAFSSSYRTRLAHFKRGPGIFKIDYALSEPIPWAAADCKRSATVHVGGTLNEITKSEHDAFYGHIPPPKDDKPYLILVQPSLFDPSRAPEGKHTAWAYCHVPEGCTGDRTEAIERQIERFAPGFRDAVLARHTWTPDDLSAWNPNLLGGDVSGGVMTLSGMIARPTLRAYRTSNPKLYLCSSSTPPGGGVHGMAGHNAAVTALRDHRFRN
ncbi:MAG: phytoene desaturase family protein [Janthinobacterium lividum]